MVSNDNPMYSKRRFDWVTVIDGATNEKVVCQLAALWEFRRTSSDGQTTKSVLYYSCIPTARHSALRGDSKFQAFPKIKYHLSGGKQKNLRLITDKVDTIVSPEAVFPVTLLESDYTVLNPSIRESRLFYHVPFPFFFREGWAPGSVNLFETFENTVLQSPSALQYINSSREERDVMYDILLDAIRCNEEVEEETPDAVIIQGALARTR